MSACAKSSRYDPSVHIWLNIFARNLGLSSARYLCNFIVNPSGPGVLFVYAVCNFFCTSSTVMAPKLTGGCLSTVFFFLFFSGGMCWMLGQCCCCKYYMPNIMLEHRSFCLLEPNRHAFFYLVPAGFESKFFKLMSFHLALANEKFSSILICLSHQTVFLMAALSCCSMSELFCALAGCLFSITFLGVSPTNTSTPNFFCHHDW